MVIDINSSNLYGNIRSFVIEDLKDLSTTIMISGSFNPRLLTIIQDAGATTTSPMPTSSFSSENDTQCGEQILNYGHFEKLVIGAILSLITLLTIAGNCLVVISVCFVKKLRQPSNYLIVSLALADLSVAIAVMPFVIVTDLIGGKWIFGHVFCNVFIAMDVMCCTASIMTLCVISIDRATGHGVPSDDKLCGRKCAPQ
ncbi:5-hydroxytryptamine receptor 7 [Spea bombifrons]|uniref:5-hydroxytryptamine receptor 7 n=1 Tax=Spea bombifrons TaxID=233779 RepID=UPI00234AF12F|nr:5-hydroxytryptamine receptor 7 [Spea bombifrons]